MLARATLSYISILLFTSKFTRFFDNDVGTGSSAIGTVGFDLLDHIETINNFTENNVLAVQPWAWDGGDEELGSVGVWSRVGHRQKTRLGVLLREVFVRERLTVDRLTTVTLTGFKVSTLQHEVRNDSVEDRVGVTEALFTGTQSSKVFGRLWNDGIVQFELDWVLRHAVNGGLEVNLGAPSSGGRGKESSRVFEHCELFLVLVERLLGAAWKSSKSSSSSSSSAACCGAAPNEAKSSPNKSCSGCFGWDFDFDAVALTLEDEVVGLDDEAATSYSSNCSLEEPVWPLE